MRTNIYTIERERNNIERESRDKSRRIGALGVLLEPSDLETSSEAEVEEAGNIRDQGKDCSIYRREDVEADGAPVGAEVRAGVLHVCDVHPLGLRVQPHIMGLVGGD